ncbi:hypothetical protein [Edaphobacter sp.]|uniref:hypothetical protein n=1 Tax=Edaphobacter sp. TaxID=1934404 RepID=UPI002DB6FB9C|nr:hypothetical protein [Edaphobacter sp.]HEU5339726.1 hypothetical protein [Edaphobacter sp.]
MKLSRRWGPQNLGFDYDVWMNFQQILAWLKFWKTGEADSEDMLHSIVLLLREARTFSERELQIAGEKGWGKRFDGTEDPMYFVSKSEVLTVLKAGKYVVQLVQVKEPYSDDLEASARNLTRQEQKKAWFEHRAWSSIDLWNGAMSSSRDLPKKEAYAVLARFALQLGDANCSAIYFPKEGWMMPNDGTAEDGLRRLIDAFPLK